MSSEPDQLERPGIEIHANTCQPACLVQSAYSDFATRLTPAQSAPEDESEPQMVGISNWKRNMAALQLRLPCGPPMESDRNWESAR